MIYHSFFRTIFTGLTLTLALFSSSVTLAKEVYVDDTCKLNPQLSESDKFAIFYKSEFRSGSNVYWFYSGRYQDGSAIVCVAKPNFHQPRPLSELKKIQFNFIDKISKDPKHKAAFLVTVHEGNGSRVPVIQYRLDLSNPDKPVLTKLRSWTSD